MFISNKEKKDINEKFDSHKFQIDNLVKHVAEIQVDIGKTDIVHLDDVRESNSTLRKMYWGADKKVKALEKTIKNLENTIHDLENTVSTVQALERTVNVLEEAINSLQVSNEVLVRRTKSLTEILVELNKRVFKIETKKPLGRPKGSTSKITVPAEKVQEMKDTGIWEDEQKRMQFVSQYIRDERDKKIEEKKQKSRDRARENYQKRKALKKLEETL